MEYEDPRPVANFREREVPRDLPFGVFELNRPHLSHPLLWEDPNSTRELKLVWRRLGRRCFAMIETWIGPIRTADRQHGTSRRISSQCLTTPRRHFGELARTVRVA